MDREERMKIAKEFSKRVVKKFGPIIKSVVVFGSTARGDFKEDSDIDIIVIYDDLILKKYGLDKSSFDMELKRIGNEVNNLVRLSPSWSIIEFIRGVQIGSPIITSVLKDGWALYDNGLFINIKNQFEKGNVRWTFEMINNMVRSSEENLKHLERTKVKIVAEDIYYGLINVMIPIIYLDGNPISSFLELEQHLERIKEISRLNESEFEFVREIVKIRNEFEHGKVKEITDENLIDFIKNFKVVREKLVNAEKELYAKSIEEKKERLKEVIKEIDDKKISELLGKVDTYNYLELDRLEFYLWLIENKRDSI